MSTPLEVIEEGEKKFVTFVEPALDRGFDDGYRGAELGKAQKSYRDRYAWVIDIQRYNKDQTLDLLQALHDELEGKKMVVEMALGNPEATAALRGYNDSIQDQQDNLQALMDSIRV